MDINMEIKSIIKMIDALKIKDLSNIIIFDVYMDDKISSDKKSVALGLIFQSKSRTLKDDEIDIQSHSFLIEAYLTLYC